MRLRLILIGMVGGLALAAPSGAAGASFHNGDGLTITAIKQIDPRLVALEVKSSALPDPANLYVLLPPGYGAQPHRRYPVLYLLHGTSGTASDWTAKGEAEKVIGARPLITVMPDIALNDGGGGWCTDWPNGAQRWETFHIDQLLPWVDANLRTIAGRGGRAIAGLSQGGFCSLSYASRHPDLFSVALGYSGAPDIWHDADARTGAMAIINATEVGLDGVPPDTFFGDPLSDGINWAAHDPATLAENLRGTRILMYWGNGQPGPYDNPLSPSYEEAAGIEYLVNRDNIDFQARLAALGIPAYFDPYGPGTHAWPYWTRDLQWSIGPIMDDLAHPPSAPARVTYTSGDDTYSVYGWSVAMHRAARELSTLADGRRGGFALSGSGSATVTTPAVYRHGARYRISVSGPHAAGTILTRSGADRRLHLEVPLGPSNPYPEYTPQAEVAGTAVYTTRVRIELVRVRRRRG